MLDPIKSPWPSSWVSIFFYQWIDATCHPFIKFMMSSLNGLVFLKSMDALRKYKDAQYMGELFIKVIKNEGVYSCAKIITNNAPICKHANMIVEDKYPQII